MKKLDPAFGYDPKSIILLPKKNFLKKAQHIFIHDEVEIIDGCRVLDIVIRSESAEKNIVERSRKQKSFLNKLAVLLK